jgi:hypothetical protein
VTRLNGWELAVQGASGATNYGTILTSSSTLNTANGFTNSLGGLIRMAGGALIGGAVTNSGWLDGYGLIDATFTNAQSGTVLANDGGTIVFAAEMTNRGSLRLDSTGGQFEFQTSLYNDGNGATGGILKGDGTLTFALGGGEGTFANTFAPVLPWTYSTRSLTFALASGTLNYEVISKDVGSLASDVFPYQSFALGTLVLPNTLTFLRLLDNTVNQGGGTQEALYVENLMLGTALTESSFSFGPSGLKIYYSHIIGDGDVNFRGNGVDDPLARVVYFGNIIPLDGDLPAVIPEPSTIALMLIGLPIFGFALRFRKSRRG